MPENILPQEPIPQQPIPQQAIPRQPVQNYPVMQDNFDNPIDDIAIDALPLLLERLRTFKGNYDNVKKQQESVKAPRVYESPAAVLMDAALKGEKINYTDHITPTLMGLFSAYEYGKAPYVFGHWGAVPHQLASPLHPSTFAKPGPLGGTLARTGYGLLAAATAATSADIGTNTYERAIKDKQEAIEGDPDYKDEWQGTVDASTKAFRNALWLGHYPGTWMYGKNWPAKKDEWANIAGTTLAAIPMGIHDTGTAIGQDVGRFFRTMGEETLKEPGKWGQWFKNVSDTAGDYAPPLFRLATSKEPWYYGTPYVMQNLSSASGIPMPYTPDKNPKGGPDLSGYPSQLFNAALNSDSKAAKNLALQAYEMRPEVRNANTFWNGLDNTWWYFNNVTLNPAHWFDGTTIPAERDPSLGKTPSERFENLRKDVGALKDSTIPYLSNFYNIADNIGQNKVSDVSDRAIVAAWNSLTDIEKQAVREMNPNMDVDALMADSEKRKAFVNKAYNKGIGKVTESVQNIPNRMAKPTNANNEPEGPSISAPPNSTNTIPWAFRPVEGEDENYFDYSNPNYKWPKLIPDDVSWLPFAPAINSLTSYPLAAINDSIGLAKDRTIAGVNYLGNRIGAGWNYVTGSGNSQSKQPPQAQTPPPATKPVTKVAPPPGTVKAYHDAVAQTPNFTSSDTKEGVRYMQDGTTVRKVNGEIQVVPKGVSPRYGTFEVF